MIYAILDSEGKCVNRIVWDGGGGWQPPEGCIAVPDEDGTYQIELPAQEQAQSDPMAVFNSLTEEQRAALLAILQPQQ